jgi:hypothetical protein
MRRRSFLALAASLALVPLRDPALAAPTPVAVDSNGGLMALLRLLPEDALGEMGIRYGDYDAQLAALGIAGRGADLDPDTWLAAMDSAPVVPKSLLVPLDPMWREGLGFDLRDVDQMVEAGASDTNILILSGQFEAATVTAAWEAGGYVPVETDGVTWYTLGADNVLFDPDFPLSDYHVGALSHMALLDDGTVAGTAKRAAMEQLLSLHAGAAGSFGVGDGAGLAAAPVDLAAAWIVDGAALVAVGDPLAAMPNNPNVPASVQERLATQAAQQAELSPLPPIALALVGATAGAGTPLTVEAFPDAPGGRAIAVVVPANEADGAMVAELVTQRLTTMPVFGHELYQDRPYADIFPEMVVDVAPDGTVIIDLTPADDVLSTLLIDLLQGRQLSILYWGA